MADHAINFVAISLLVVNIQKQRASNKILL